MAFNGIITTDASMQIKLVSAYNDQVGYTLTIADFIARVKQIYHYETISMIKFDQAFGGNDGYRAQVVFNTCETLRIINDTSLMNGYSESGNMYFITENTDILDYANYNYFVSTSAHNDIQYSAQGYFASSPTFTLPDGLSYRATGGGGNPTTIIYYDPTCFTSVYINGVLPSAYEYIDNLQGLTGDPGSATYENITWDKILEYLDNSVTWERYNVTGDQMVDGVWNKFFNGISDASEHTINTSWGVTIKYNPDNNPGCIVSWTENGNTYSQGYQGGDNSKYGIRFAINNTTQEAVFLILRAEYSSISHTPNDTAVYNGSYNKSQSNRQSLYRMLMGGIAPAYNWTSVSAISGKNKTVSLTTIKEESINDGSPVDDATASAFNNAPNSCSVGGIISKDLPIINDNPLSIAVKYNIPELTDSVYSSCKVVAKKNKIPKSKTDGDKILDVSPSSHGCVINGLDQNTKYYVVVFVEDNLNNKAESDPADCTTGRNEEYNFAYTGSIQTFTAPKTGIYQLETWGAQGGNASDDNLVARGGYGAYAKGEIMLVQGETLYIGVGGQNGYNGGGLKIWDGSEIAIIWSGENNKLTAQISNNSILFKMYSGNTVIYSFTSQTGTSVSDISKINAGFLIDTEREVAKPSFIYDIGSSSYKYNSETPTDAEMADIYTWLQAGL